MTAQRSFDSQSFMDNIIGPLVGQVFPKGRNPHARPLYPVSREIGRHRSNMIKKFA
jgi:hypothetical protein